MGGHNGGLSIDQIIFTFISMFGFGFGFWWYWGLNSGL
jgi:hypothetical protein